MVMNRIDPVEILLVEDSPADVDLTREAFEEGKLKNNLHVCKDGVEALDYLYQRNGYEDAVRPDLILLDLNMPRMNGHEVMQQLDKDQNLRTIPIVVLTTSDDQWDIVQSYENSANCYITKPVGLNQFMSVIQSIEDFWFSVVKLPRNPR